MLVENIEKTVRETPEKEEGDDKGEGVDKRAALDFVSDLYRNVEFKEDLLSRKDH